MTKLSFKLSNCRSYKVTIIAVDILYECNSLHHDDPITTDDHDNHDRSNNNTKTPEMNPKNTNTTIENHDNIADDTRWNEFFNKDTDELKTTTNYIEKNMDNLTTCFDK